MVMVKRSTHSKENERAISHVSLKKNLIENKSPWRKSHKEIEEPGHERNCWDVSMCRLPERGVHSLCESQRDTARRPLRGDLRREKLVSSSQVKTNFED